MTAAAQLSDPERQAGIGGCLAILIVLLLLLSPLAVITRTYQSLADAEALYPWITSNALWQEGKQYTWIMIGVRVAIMALSGLMLLVWRRWYSVFLAIFGMWVAGPILGIVMAYDLADIAGHRNILEPEYQRAIFTATLFALVSTAYLLCSRRVQRTYAIPKLWPAFRLSALWVSPKRWPVETRQVAFYAICWIVVTVAAIWIFGPFEVPYGYSPFQSAKALGTIFVPPLFFVVGRWAYRKFVISSSTP